jgi:hypothetical protein
MSKLSKLEARALADNTGIALQLKFGSLINQLASEELRAKGGNLRIIDVLPCFG